MAAISKGARGSNPVDHLTDDIILEILSWLPIKSICRFNCVSKAWRNLISHPDYRKNLPQALSGFLYRTYNNQRLTESARHFTNITGRGPPLVVPSLSFLPSYRDITVLDCCNGMLLCRRHSTASAIRYVFCNPATEEWTELPEWSATGKICMARLGFDLAVSPHFHVLDFLETGADTNGYTFVDGLEIYSSNTGEWAHRDSGWSEDATLYPDTSSVFFNGFLHVYASEDQEVLVVDIEGKVWRTIAVPYGAHGGFIGLSQGCLYYANTIEDHDYELSVYVRLQDHAMEEWIFKHSVSTSTLIGRNISSVVQYYNLITIHPECNRIFLISHDDDSLRCYDTDHRKVQLICNFGNPHHLEGRCLPYVPLYSKVIDGAELAANSQANMYLK